MNEPLDPTTSPLAIQGLTVSYGERLALLGVDFVTPPGQLSAIVGPNGAGKSTLLKAALGIQPRVAGELLAYGRPLPRPPAISPMCPSAPASTGTSPPPPWTSY